MKTTGTRTDSSRKTTSAAASTGGGAPSGSRVDRRTAADTGVPQENRSLVEISHLLADLVVYENETFDQFLKNLISLLSEVIPVDSCLVYFFDQEQQRLMLAASKKKRSAAVGTVTLEVGEGITGWVARTQELVVLHEKAYEDERFKYIKELPEDRYEAFLSVPIINRQGTIGVVNLQHKHPYRFANEQIEIVQAMVRIISSAFEKILLERKVGTLSAKLAERKLIEKAKGLLMKRDRISESAAFTQIRREAMRKRKSMGEIAEAVLLVYG